MKLRISLLVLSVVLLVSVACGGEAALTLTLTATPAATPILPSPAAPTSTPTLTPTPTATAIPTATPAAGPLERRRQDLHIPGMAISVVKDDEVIFARGFGLTDLKNDTPVTPETIFAIGSATKAFTATLVGMLVDQGDMDWDDPVTTHIPYFTLNTEGGGESSQVTIRDMLSHRTGYTRMGLLIANGTVPREETLLAATDAEPWSRLRESFYYNNVMYLAGGVAAGNAAAADCDTLLGKRIFEPLRMTDSNTSIIQSQADGRLSLGYLWDDDLEVHIHQPMRDLDNIGPAGAINSNVLDMAQWVRFQLGFGAYEGDRLVTEEQHEETWTSQIEIGGGIRYGLGWFLREWHGQPVIEHGGNIDGFASQVALLPESNLGFVLLTNVTATPLQQESINMVWDALLGELEAAPSTTVRT